MASKVNESVVTRYWLRHEADTWIPAKIQSQDDAQVVFKAENNEIITLPAAQLKDLQQVSDDQLAGVDDVCSLVNVNEGALLWTVRRRYLKKQIYTRVARTIIALNPFTPLPIYSSQILEQYTSCANSADLPPHIFAIGQDAIRGLRESSNDQAVLISGESGAGKTESAKFIMSFVADAMRTSQGDRMEKVLRTNVVLEAFGNAMTVRNNNSSRFGKWLDLHFSTSLQSLGATITSYLLETTRVVNQAPKERGYHIFFQLLQAREKFGTLGLEDPKKYNYLNKGLSKAPGINDQKNFEELEVALTHFGIDSAKQLEIWTVLAIILYLGNMDFKEVGEGSEILDKKPLEKLTSLMEVDATKFLELMTIRKVVVGKEVTQAKNRLDQARGVKDALSRLLYGQLFLWLIRHQNGLLTDREPESTDRLIGVLDIAGFECFEYNSLEQLLINLSNEHLQQHFNDSMIKSEEADCAKEGVTLPKIEGFDDNADILALIDTAKGNGILDLLDETCLTKFSSATDLTFVGKVVKAQKDHKRLIVAKNTNKAEFGIKHFAGCVTYTCDGWLEKNLEKLPLDTADVLRSSGIELITEISEAMGLTMPGGGKNSRMKSVTGGFRSSLKELMTKIHRANPHYIRCVKPNTAKEAGRFQPPLVMEQLLFGGMFAAVNIRQQGYAYRLPHKDFICLYACIAEQLEHVEAHDKATTKPKSRVTVRKSVVAVSGNVKERAKATVEGLPAVLKKLGYDIGPENFALGHTKVFTKFAAVKPLDDSRQFALKSVATQIQAAFRGHLARVATAQRRKVQEAVKELINPVLNAIGKASSSAGKRRRTTTDGTVEAINSSLDAEAMKTLLDNLLPQLKEAEELDFDNDIISMADWVHRRIRRELNAIDAVEKLRTGVDIMMVEKALNQCTRLQLPDFPARTEVTARLEALQVQKPLVKAIENALSVDKKDRQVPVLQEVLQRVEDAGLREDTGRWLPELRGVHLMNEVLSALAEGLAATDADAAEKLAKEREEATKKASEQAATKAEALKQEAKAALKTKAKEDQNFEQELIKQRAQLEEEFKENLAKAMAEQKASVEAAVAEKMAAEQAKTEMDKERRTAQEAAEMVEKKLMQKMAAERAAAEEELTKRLKEVSEQLMAERKSAEDMLKSHLAEERAKVEQAQKQISERIEAERLAHEKLKKAVEDMEAKEKDFKLTLKEEREAAENELAAKLKQERSQAEQELAEKCRAEREAAAKETRQEVKDKMESEHAEAQRELERKLYEEHKDAEKELANRLIEKHAAAQQSFTDQLAAEKATAQKEFEEKLARQKEEVEDKLNKKVAEARAEVELAQKQILEQVEAEKASRMKLKQALEEMEDKEDQLKRTMRQEREAAEQELADRLKKEREQAEQKLAEKCRAEREAAAKETRQEVKDKMETEHAEAQRELERRLFAEHKEAEQELVDKLLEKHALEQQSFADKLAQEKAVAQKEYEERVAAEKEKAKVSEQLIAERQAAEEKLNQKVAEGQEKIDLAQKQIDERMEAERAAREKLKKALDDMAIKEEDFEKALKSERKTAEQELEEKLKAQRLQAEKDLAERCHVEREAAANETRQEVKDQMLTAHAEARRELERQLYAEHKEAEQDLVNRLVEKHAVAQQSFADQLAREKLAAQKEFEEKLAAEAAKAEAAQIIASKSAEELLAMEREKMEKDLAERLQKERLDAQNQFQKRLQFAQDDAQKEYDQRVAIEKRGRRSIPGLVMSERSQVMSLLRTAEMEMDAEGLEMLLNCAAEDGYKDDDDDGVLAVARRKFQELQSPDVIEEYLELEEENAEKQNPELQSLARLYNLLNQMRKLGADADTHGAARKLQLALVQRATNQRLQSIFESADKEEVELAQQIFGDLSNFSDLKLPADWQEATKAVFPRNRKSRRMKSGKQVWGLLDSKGNAEESVAAIDKAAYEKMLSHTKDCIAESMTRVPEAECSQEDYDAGASLNFINLTTYMTDKPAQECQRQACHDAILELAKQPYMRDEVYMQILKQLRNNPDGRSLRLGWDIMYHLCSSTPPSPALIEFVRAFTKDQKKKLMAKPDTAAWAEEATENVYKALGGSSLWKRVGDFWETVFWCVDAASGNIISSYHPKLDEASAHKGKNITY